ncbi:hypothetical protein MMZ74_31265 (plasmid) [Pseudomonas aeruginosa]|uniref:hypothetical protein n=1 Tax=Pseudomonas aeruginosa TaxID=287 RepID=UPI00053E14E0|nr:hypothetical protein [Pseudomonas aeruginosa]MEC6340458.1 ead/Ea22-like family protein [Pseudomonas aeruginosa]UTP65376.1 hypothetical protein MMZ74_31265 [Pseudomonas aeruginosa]HBO8033537.1 ead/Ea22-like family protein [Pseudomonas aeruginosa]HBO8098981.1 ead/Ea22-like family protein [Pseudomonas aeruginosa]HBO8509854.1 ead/Ea22-like family protein [Pseudomonas aeruginosa]
MTDHAELRRLAEVCDVSRCADEGEERRRLHDFYDCIEPELILSMLNEIAENDSVVAVWRGRTQRTEEERDRLKAENEVLRGALQAVVDDPTWRSNDNTLWPKIIKAMNQPGATSSP